MLTCTEDYKSRKLVEGTDWESVRDRYVDILESYKENVPSAEERQKTGQSFKHGVDTSKEVIMSKLKRLLDCSIGKLLTTAVELAIADWCCCFMSFVPRFGVVRPPLSSLLVDWRPRTSIFVTTRQQKSSNPESPPLHPLRPLCPNIGATRLEVHLPVLRSIGWFSGTVRASHDDRAKPVNHTWLCLVHSIVDSVHAIGREDF